jgi:seryl-tRNA synthetase
MALVTIKRNILLKAIVTETLREEVAGELQEAADQIAQRIQELDAAGRRYITDLQRTDLQRAMALRQQVEAEKKKQEEVRERLLERKEQVSQWKDGDEVVRGTIEGTVEVKEGDNLAVLLGGTELVVKDDIVTRIRELPPEELATSIQSAVLEAGEVVGEGDSGVIGNIETP